MEEVAPEPEHVTQTAGQQLRAARTERNKPLADYAASLRISEAMLDALERDAIHELPPGPYAAGFARSYALALGLDDKAIVSEIRAAQRQGAGHASSAYVAYEPVEPARVPSRLLAWTAAGIALTMVIAYLVWKSSVLQPDAATPPPPATTASTPAATNAQPATPAVAAAAPTTGPAIADDAVIRIAASSQVWFSLEDENGRSQFDLTLRGGEFYTIKPQQRGLRLRTGRPQSLRILVGEQRLPQLGPDDAVISGVVLDAASLGQRLRAPAPTTAPSSPSTALPAAVGQR